MVRFTVQFFLLCSGLVLLLTSGLLGFSRLQSPQTAFIVTYQCHPLNSPYQGYTLYRMTATGQALPPFALPLLEPTDLHWSADQQWITLTGMQEDGNWDIYRVRPDGSDLQNLSNAPGEDTMPVFSKD